MSADLEVSASSVLFAFHSLTDCLFLGGAAHAKEMGNQAGACLSGRLKCSRDREEERESNVSNRGARGVGNKLNSTAAVS